MNCHCDKFLKNEFLAWSIFGALGRSNTYSGSASERDKKCFHDTLRKKLSEMVKEYDNPVPEEKHLSNIRELADEMTRSFPQCLRNKRFRIGIAQKSLNLYLKYLWRSGAIPMPPHCPFDNRIIKELPECAGLKWTSIDKIEDYNRLVEAAKKEANGKPLSEWELEIWNQA